jgi:hypothetical protein
MAQSAYVEEQAGHCTATLARRYASGRCWARTSDLRLVEAALSQLS